MYKVYYAPVTEFEIGWGRRPDGYLVTTDKSFGDKFSTKDRGKIWSMENGSEFSIKDGEWKLGIVSNEEFYQDIINKDYKTLWIGKNLENYVEV